MSEWIAEFEQRVWPSIRITYLSDLSEIAAINTFNLATAHIFDVQTRTWRESVFDAGIAKKFGPAYNPGATYWRMPEAVRFFGTIIQRWQEEQQRKRAASYGTQRSSGVVDFANLPRDLRKVAPSR